jgi:hypothetical protein
LRYIDDDSEEWINLNEHQIEILSGEETSLNVVAETHLPTVNGASMGLLDTSICAAANPAIVPTKRSSNAITASNTNVEQSPAASKKPRFPGPDDRLHAMLQQRTVAVRVVMSAQDNATAVAVAADAVKSSKDDCEGNYDGAKIDVLLTNGKTKGNEIYLQTVKELSLDYDEGSASKRAQIVQKIKDKFHFLASDNGTELEAGKIQRKITRALQAQVRGLEKRNSQKKAKATGRAKKGGETFNHVLLKKKEISAPDNSQLPKFLRSITELALSTDQKSVKDTLAQIISETDEDMQQDHATIAAPAIVFTLKQWWNRTHIQALGCAALAKVTYKGTVTTKAAALQVGGIETAVLAMKNFPGDEAIQLNGCRVLQNLSQDDIENSKHLLVKEIKLVVDAMNRFSNNKHVQKHACALLCGLSEKKELKEPIIAAAAQVLGTAIGKHNDQDDEQDKSIQQWGRRAMYNLTKEE